MNITLPDTAPAPESALLAVVAGQIVKVSVGRERPDAHFSSAKNSRSSNNTSFYSGHTTLAFSLAVSSAMIASLEKEDAAPYIWAAGLALAGTTAYLRIAADRHYFTDVIVGAVVGSAIGFSVPYFLHQPEDSKSSVKNLQFLALPGPEGLVASLKWTW